MRGWWWDWNYFVNGSDVSNNTFHFFLFIYLFELYKSCVCVIFFFLQVVPQKMSQSETCLSSKLANTSSSVKKTVELAPSLDEETFSTDSNCSSILDESEKKKKRKLPFHFSRKHKTKTSWHSNFNRLGTHYNVVKLNHTSSYTPTDPGYKLYALTA